MPKDEVTHIEGTPRFLDVGNSICAVKLFVFHRDILMQLHISGRVVQPFSNKVYIPKYFRLHFKSFNRSKLQHSKETFEGISE